MSEEKKQGLDLIIKKISLEEGKITELQFDYSNDNSKIDNYTAKITPIDIFLKKNSQYVYPNVYVKMNRSDLKTYWNFNHCCGEAGFGYRIEDTCPACEAKDKLVEFNEKEVGKFMISAGYSKGLYNILTHLPTYCVLMEYDINNTIKQLYSTFEK